MILDVHVKWLHSSADGDINRNCLSPQRLGNVWERVKEFTPFSAITLRLKIHPWSNRRRRQRLPRPDAQCGCRGHTHRHPEESGARTSPGNNPPTHPVGSGRTQGLSSSRGGQFTGSFSLRVHASTTGDSGRIRQCLSDVRFLPEFTVPNNLLSANWFPP